VEELKIDSAGEAHASKHVARGANSGGASDEVAALITAGAANPASPAAVALADAWRRAGRADEAVRVAREALQHQPESMSARVALALSLLDLGKAGEARGELARAFDASPERALGRAALERLAAEAALRRGPPASLHSEPPAPAQPLELLEEIGGDEFDRAFDAAESEAEGVIDANQVAEQAIRAVEQGAAEDLVSVPESPFATATMAGLLERQGHVAEARAVRERAAARPDEGNHATDPARHPASDAKARDRARILATLERWLENLRRGAA
jgi:tetratricopeptide (TPR) repeat protein